MDRRTLLRGAVVGAGTVAFGFTVSREALGHPPRSGSAPYGTLGAPDAHGIQLPPGFRSRVVARSGQRVPGTGHVWHGAPDGGACFADGPGWIYVSNAELDAGAGGVGALRFDVSGAVTDAYSVLDGTRSNCAGGATPWATWLSCEETTRGFVFETDPFGARPAVRRDAMGRFTHEAAACDSDRRVIYLTEDEPDGGLYRFVPDTWGDLSSGRLQVLTERDGVLAWRNVPDPSAATTATRRQVAGTLAFDGGEGCYYCAGLCYFTTKGDNRVRVYDAEAHTVTVVYDQSAADDPCLSGVDNITGATCGDLFVAEDGGSMEICVISAGNGVAPFLRITGQNDSEICGPAFSPAGDRLYFSSQRGTSGDDAGGITYEVSGPFRSAG
ncbi:alkaline phosphatase PhoX [Streptomyces sp. SBT349]|uniref:alkaline phosphatase PhoX n=1 Tax=Streptomyces sp. SBT349 TaxID=1580539 RepID=UPI00066DF498|nr:alkaline phosphatase PhoX [Streptomyces sp. SBT349]